MSSKQDQKLTQRAFHSMKRWDRFRLLLPSANRSVRSTDTHGKMKTAIAERITPPISPTLGRYSVSYEEAHDLLRESRNLKTENYISDKQTALQGPVGVLP